MNYINILRNYSLKNNLEIYLVGGAVRDLLLNKSPSDLDFALKGDCHSIAKDIADILKASYVNMHGDVARVVKNGSILDFTNFRGNSIEGDLKARDFTINSIAQNIGTGEYIDPLNGIEDINRKVIRLTSEKALEEDPVRMLRAVRLSGRLGFEVENETKNRIMESSALLDKTAGERILDELLKIFEVNNSHVYIELLDELRLLEEIFPIMGDMKRIGWCRYHVVDAFTHSLLTLKFLEKMLERVYDTPPGDKVRLHLESELNGRQRFCTVKLAALLHDIGKPKAMQVIEDRVSFRGHDLTGGEELKALGKRLPFSVGQRELIRSVIIGHMRILVLFKQGATSRAMYRLFRDLGENTPDVILSSLCDVTATRSLIDDEGESERYFNFAIDLFEKYFEYVENQKRKFISGRDVIEILNLQGSRIGDVLKRVDEEVFYGNINNREEALNFIHQFRG